MALTVLESYKRACLKDEVGLDLTTATKLKLQIMTSSHTLDSDADEFLDDLLSGNRVMISDGFTGIVAATGANLDAADGVTLNDTDNARVGSHGFVLYNTGTESTDRLICHDSSVVITSDGANDTLNFNASGIFDY